VLWLPEAYEQLLRELVLHCRWKIGSSPHAGTQCGSWSWTRPAGEAASCLFAGQWRRRAFQLELAPADHYGVALTPEFKTRLETFLGGRALRNWRATTPIARQKRKSWERRN